MHPGPVIGAQFVQQGRALLVAFIPAPAADPQMVRPTMRLWSVHDGALLKEIEGPPFPLTPPRTSPDGNIIVALDALGRPRPLDLEAGRFGAPVVLQGASGITAIAPTSDGHVLAADGQQVGLWAWPSGARVRTFDLGSRWPEQLTVNAEGTRGAVAVGDRGDVALLMLDRQEPVRVLPGNGRSVVGLDLDPKGESVAIAEEGGTLRVHRFQGPRRFDPIQGGRGLFSADGQRIFVGYPTPSIHVVADGTRQASILSGWPGLIRVLDRGPALAVLVNQRHVVLTTLSGTPLHLEQTAGTARSSQAFGQLLDAPKGGVPRALTWAPAAGVSVWSGGGERVASGHEGLDLLGATALKGDQVALHHRSLDGAQITLVTLTDLDDVRRFPVRAESPSHLSTGPKGNRIFITSQGVDDPLWRADVRTGRGGRQTPDKGKWSTVCHGPDGQIAALVFSPAPGWRKTPSGSVYLWANHRAKGKRIILEVAGRLGRGRQPDLRTCAFTPSGRTLIVAGPNGIHFVDARRGRRRRKHIDLPDQLAFSMALSPDGRWLAAGDAEGAIRLWKTDDGAAGPTLRGHLDGVHHLHFSADGAHLLSMSADTTGLIWRLPPL